MTMDYKTPQRHDTAREPVLPPPPPPLPPGSGLIKTYGYIDFGFLKKIGRRRDRRRNSTSGAA
jgi:hypothetical protein